MFNKLLPVFLGAKEYDHLSFRYNSHSEPLDLTLSANEFISRSVDLADWLVDTGLFNSIPLANDPRCREFILCAFWIIRLGCIVIPLCAGIENFMSIFGSLRSYCSPRSVQELTSDANRSHDGSVLTLVPVSSVLSLLAVPPQCRILTYVNDWSRQR